MVKQQSRFAINPLYVVAVAMCCVCQIETTLFQGLLFGLIVVLLSLICVNLVSLTEKFADKNLRAFIIALLAGLLIFLGEYVFELLNKEFFSANMQNLKWCLLAVITLSIVPTYFETRLATKTYFANMFYSLFMYLILTVLYSAVMEFCTLGSVAGYQIFKTFTGLDFASQLFFQLFVIAIFVILTNWIYQRQENRRMQFDLLVERYKIEIKREASKLKGGQHD